MRQWWAMQEHWASYWPEADVEAMAADARARVAAAAGYSSRGTILAAETSSPERVSG